MIFVDTNYFLRLLLKDNARQHQLAKQLFRDGASGKVKLISSTIVFFEIYWVLFSFYKKKQRSDLTDILDNILMMKFINFSERIILEETVRSFAIFNIDLEDAYNLAYAKQMRAADFKTFDKHLLKKFIS